VPNSEWARLILRTRPDMAAFSAITPAFYDALDVCRKVKRLDDSVFTVFGGAHASWAQALLLERFGEIDACVAGEGEGAMTALAGEAKHDTIEGLHFRDGTAVRSGPPRTTLCGMDDLPFPAFDLLDGFPRRYVLPLFGYRRHPGASLVSSRGCVYRCSYCDRSVFGRTFRWNSPEYTFELVKWLRTGFGVRHVIFYDDLFTLNRDRVARLCGLLRSWRRSPSFTCIVRIGHIDRELIAELKSAGCWMVNVGIESGDQDILDRNKEGLRLDHIRRDIGLLHDAGIWVKGLFMMGFPGETAASIEKTIAFANSLPLKDINVTAFTPFPGSPVYRGIGEKGTFDDDWEKMDCMNFVFVPREIESMEMLECLHRRFLSRFYTRPFSRAAWRAMLWQSPHSYWRLLRHASAFLSYRNQLDRS
jgi:radical SAM superfamily enzyme YgiQ (UPF0313 family)